MTTLIFCPSNHLVLSSPHCDICGWRKPAAVGLGQPVWGPLDLGAGLGGPGRGVYAGPACAQGVAVFPLRNGELVGLNLSDGTGRWRTALPAGLMARRLAAFGDRILLGLSDERPLDQAGAGYLAVLDPLSGIHSRLWEPGVPLLGSPLIVEQGIIMRTSKPELVSLKPEPGLALSWRRQLQSWYPLMPVIVDATGQPIVLLADGNAMQGEGKLLAISVQDGELLWQLATDGFLAHPPVQTGDTIVYRQGAQKLAAVTLEGGQRLWEKEYRRVYSGLQAGGRGVFVVVRGEAPSGEKGHYLLQALDPINSNLVWQTPLPGRVRNLHLLANDMLLMGSDAGTLLGCETVTGEIVWEYQLGSDEDPIQTEFCPENGWALAGTYAGKVVAVQVAGESQANSNPELALEQGEMAEAAALYALQGDYSRAAEIFASQLGETDHALALYEHAEQYRAAGELARASGLHARALNYFGLAKDALAQAELLLEMGDQLEAGRKFEQAGDLVRAAGLYEAAGETRRALNLYQKLGDIPAVLRLFLRTQLVPDDVEFLARQGRLLEAGRAAVTLGAWERAAKLFQEANDSQLELETLLELARSRPEHWSLERLASLARSLGQFQHEALACELLGEPIQAAEAYHRAARQAEQLHAGDEQAIASLYEQALHFFEEAGLYEPCQECRAKVVHYRRLPRVIVVGRTERAFREGEFNTLQLTIHNIGRGIAHEVSVQVDSLRFEVDTAASGLFLRRLAPQAQQTMRIYLKPMKEQIGDEVPLALEWSWKDAPGQRYGDQSSTPVKVKGKSESQTGGTPATIHYHGPVYQAEDGRIEVVEGDKIGPGAQKGDKVEIRRGEGMHLVGEGPGTVKSKPDPARAQAVFCPNCHLRVEAEAVFCPDCGYALANKE